ncbi:MAG TPA: sulfate ABC transporter permease subunit CysT [Blastocatellia bacterium]|jgi:sulfate ABC transporter, permease protein CysT|nr:sulfate ABC transporter permease subunit CysT [Blastocatellia bacterium]
MSSVQANLNAPQRIAPARISIPWGRWGLRATAFLYLGFMVALPLATIIKNGVADGLPIFWEDVTNATAFAALKLTLTTSVIITMVNMVMGTLTAYVLVRFRFPGKGLLNALIDMPFAIPTLVTGVMLVALYGPQRTVGAWLTAHGIQVIFATPGIVLALLVITYPFVIRAVQPVLMEIEKGQEEAAYTIGASKFTTFRRVVLPTITPALITGSLLCFARALGEFGSVVVVAGNIPGVTLTAPVYVFGQIESQNQRGASAMSILLLALSFTLILTVEWMQGRNRKSHVSK